MITFQRDSESFLRDADPLLYRQEARNNLIIGVASRTNLFTDAPFFATVGERVAAVRTPPRKILLSWGEPEAAAELAHALPEDQLDMPGAHGPDEVVEAFAEAFAQRTGRARSLGMRLRVHEARSVNDVPTPEGRFRAATVEEVELLGGWAEAFVTETGTEQPRSGTEVVARYVESERLFVWDRGGARAMAAATRETRNGTTVSLVYTPAENRGHGYATATVARLSAQLLAAGRQFCSLFTDQANPTSNAIYARIGYVPLGDSCDWLFS